MIRCLLSLVLCLQLLVPLRVCTCAVSAPHCEHEAGQTCGCAEKHDDESSYAEHEEDAPLEPHQPGCLAIASTASTSYVAPELVPQVALAALPILGCAALPAPSALPPPLSLRTVLPFLLNLCVLLI